MALKLDMSKAYYQVELEFLKAMLMKMRFAEHLISLFMECVVSSKYQISHAGQEFRSIVPSRGIRQGDPLSSYLFLICMEGLSALVRNYEQKKLIRGIRVVRGAPIISHIFFADVTYIYCQTRNDIAQQLTNMLHVF